jgi:NADH:ubiquinone reductase (non-electrogenic)
MEVREKKILLSNGDSLPYGVCLWSTGNSSRPLTRDLAAQVPEQKQFAAKRPEQTKLAVDDHLRIIGTARAFAVGDCSTIVRGSLPPTAQVRC